MNSYDLSSSVAIITGGAGGFGRAIAEHFLSAGASVSLWDASADSARGVADELGCGSARIATRLVDVTDMRQIDAAVAADRRAFGRIDVLVNNAGILGDTASLWESDPATFRRVVDVNLTGAYLCMRAVIPVMRAQAPQPHRGHIVNVSSIQGKEGMPFSAAYSASKAGLIGLTKTAGKELARDAVFVNCVTPAAVETAMATEITAQRRAEILGRIPMGRFAEVDEVAKLIAWLASADCSFSTGAVFDLSGGRATW